MTFTAELGTYLSMPGNLALGYQLTTTTTVADAGQWIVTLTDALVDDATSTDAPRYGVTISDAEEP